MQTATAVDIRARLHDGLAFAGVLGLTAFVIRVFVDFSVPPVEDAAILMRYAEHVADGLGVVWNPGEAPVDGATDFLFMLMAAGLHWLGLSLERAFRLLTLAAHGGTLVIVYFGMRRVQGAGVAPATLTAAFVTAGPGLALSAIYFAAPAFTFGVALAWLLGQRIALRGAHGWLSLTAFALACLFAALVRPEGVLVAGFLFCGVALLIPGRSAGRMLVAFASVFGTLGVLYLVWRTLYFGDPLPNPFYKKGGGTLYWASLRASVTNTFWLTYPMLPAWVLALRSRDAARLALGFAIPLFGFAFVWVLMSNEMNIAGRFQYPTMLLAALGWYPLVRGLPGELGLPRFGALPGRTRAALALALLLVFGFVFSERLLRSVASSNPGDGRLAMARMLSDYADRGYTMAVTEAGLLPFYSRWRAIDTWGLNDAWIAHHGGRVTEAYLREQRPDLIMWHGFFSPGRPRTKASTTGAWSEQVDTLHRYALDEGFTLAAVFGGELPDDTHYYWVRPSLPDHDEIVRRIRELEYAWYPGGRPAINRLAELSGASGSR